MPRRKPIPLKYRMKNVDKIIREAEERGEFDNLPGAGKPIPGLGKKPYDELWWLKSLLKREELGYTVEAMAVRTEIDKALQKAATAPSESALRTILGDVNDKIRHMNRTQVAGPPSNIAEVNVNEAVRRFREQRAG